METLIVAMVFTLISMVGYEAKVEEKNMYKSQVEFLKECGESDKPFSECLNEIGE